VTATVRRFPGLIAEYRTGEGRLLGIMTAVRDEATRDVCLQHIVVWPDAPGGTLTRMLRDVEIDAWRDLRPARIFLDVEHQHPYAAQLRAVAERRGFRLWHADHATTWFVKEREG
jgi:hypothetical protein